jgi:glycosyltransferase involved in cell wall biosynthesis
VSGDFKRIFVEKSSQDIASKTIVIPNGFDEEDFAIQPLSLETKKVLTYIGTISDAYDVSALIGALTGLSDQLKSQLIIRFVGNTPISVEKKFTSTGITIEFTGYVDHSKSVEYLLLSDMLLLVIPKVANNNGILPGKIFEYLAAQKPILAIGPVSGDLANIMQETKCGQLFDYPDREGMLNFLSDNLSKKSAALSNREIAGKYSRKQLTKRIAQLLNDSNQKKQVNMSL